MDDGDKAKLRRAIMRAMDHARPVRGRDEVAIRTSDWHAIIDFVGNGKALDTVAESRRQAGAAAGGEADRHG